MSSKKILSIASDHGGFSLKSKIIEALSAEFQFIDEGPSNADSVDYPDFALKVCEDVNSKKADLGVLICTTGIGMSISANKVKGIRAALCHNEDGGKFSRLHNNANVLCLGAKYVGGALGEKIARIFASTEFEGGRHERRVGKMNDIENCSCG